MFVLRAVLEIFVSVLGGFLRKSVAPRRGLWLAHVSVAVSAAFGSAATFGSAAALTAVFTGISAAASRGVTIALLVYVALVGRSNLLDYLSVAVVASNADGGVGEFLLDLHTWGEDDAACGDEGGTYEVNLLNALPRTPNRMVPRPGIATL